MSNALVAIRHKEIARTMDQIAPTTAGILKDQWGFLVLQVVGNETAWQES